jgi:hypothetical protein
MTQVRACILVSACGLSVCALAHAGRPLTIDDAEPVQFRWWQIEAGVIYLSEADREHWDAMASVGYGVVKNLEVSAAMGAHYQRAAETFGDEELADLTDLICGVKWKLFTREKSFADQSLSVGIKFPTADDDVGTGEFDGDATWIISRGITDKLNIHGNIGYTIAGDRDDEEVPDLLHYGIAMDYRLTGRLQPVAEVFGHTHTQGESDTSGLINVGLRYLLGGGLTLDAAIATRLWGDAPDVIATIGFTWDF